MINVNNKHRKTWFKQIEVRSRLNLNIATKLYAIEVGTS